MTDELTPEQESVRRLLAEARHDLPAPSEVVTRLDDTLASLVAERGGARPPEAHVPVIDLAARRRRRAGVGLLAAAAVVVGGVALGQGLPRLSGSNDASSSAGGDMATSQDQAPRDDAGSAGEGDSTAPGPESLKSSATGPEVSYPTLSAYDADLDNELLDLRTTDSARSVESGLVRGLKGCGLGGTGQGRRVPAQVDGESGVVIFRRPDADVQRVDLYVCGSSVPVRTLTLPAP